MQPDACVEAMQVERSSAINDLAVMLMNVARKGESID